MKKKLVADEKKKVADVAAVTQHAQPASSSPPAAVSTPMPEPVAVVPEPEPVAVPVAGPDGRRRAIIEGVTPQLDGGRFAIKRTVGDTVTVEADVFTDGHDALSCVLQYRKAGAGDWQETPMRALVNDRWQGEFVVLDLGRYEYTVTAWVDAFKSWRHDLGRWVQAEDVAIALRVGEKLVEQASQRATGGDAQWLARRAQELVGQKELEYRRRLGLDEDLARLMTLYADRSLALQYDRILAVVVDDERARFSSWYEMFPRSCSAVP
ncbi:MAG TPA: DUF3416 domain-containing protein, partial [Candidatus Competibacteraceae bacterium]|nr:DUF3416 domain-containing protein [Candidatus Competibacteraceae bacterium]